MAQEAKKGRRRTRPHEYMKKKCYINWNPSFGTFSICYKPVSPNYFIGSYRDAEIHHHSKIDDKNHPKNCCRKKKLEKVKKNQNTGKRAIPVRCGDWLEASFPLDLYKSKAT